MTVVIPLRVDLLTTKIERLTELSASSAATVKELEHVKRELAETRAAMQASLQKSPFQGQSVYPIGFDDVVIGTPVTELTSRYPDGEWDEERAYYSVTAKTDGVVSAGTYYFTETGSNGKVAHILFHLAYNNGAASNLIQKHFFATFGEPNAIRRKNRLWKATRREWITLDSLTYSVYAANAPTPTYEFDLAEK